MTQRLLHYSADPALGPIEARPQGRAFFKPHGLWLSPEGEDDWPHWCRSENFRLEQLVCVYEVKLMPGADILWVTTPEEIDAVSETWGAPFEGFASIGLGVMHIRWADMAMAYDGIIIAPYQWSRRLHPGQLWYYPWDCASGCIWDPDAIASLTRVETEP